MFSKHFGEREREQAFTFTFTVHQTDRVLPYGIPIGKGEGMRGLGSGRVDSVRVWADDKTPTVKRKTNGTQELPHFFF